jgi:hypothetical protein
LEAQAGASSDAPFLLRKRRFFETICLRAGHIVFDTGSDTRHTARKHLITESDVKFSGYTLSTGWNVAVASKNLNHLVNKA